ncbi:hypothetical protein KC8_02345 [Sphingomonas sp. KC8]|nr:hypothetical protein KC8_02345 [Sphingomonas sp. KC8]
MTKKRLSSSDRRDSIIDAATGVFAQHGFSGAKTQEIAKAAKVSEALVFRHFPNKVAIYRAVLRHMIRSQNVTFALLSGVPSNTRGLIDMLRRTFLHSLSGASAINAEGMRIFFASLTGDGTYATLAYRRSVRLWLTELDAALSSARASGDLVGAPITPQNIFTFIEHVSSMMLVSRTHPNGIVPYVGDDQQLLRDAVRFCARGIGLTEAAIEAHKELLELPSQPLPDTARLAPPRKETKTSKPRKSGSR